MTTSFIVETNTISGNAFTTRWSYNSADLPVSMTYPDNETVQYTYNSRMLLETLTGDDDYVTATSYDLAGRMTQRVLGNGLTQDYAYYGWTVQGGRLQRLSTSRPSDQTTLQNMTYAYDPVGNILSITDALAGPQTQTFTYDSLYRLLSATVTGGPAPYTETYAYDAATGNLINKAGQILQYNDPAHAHAVTDMAANAYAYDANGSQTTRIVGGETYDLAYDAEGRLTTVTKGAETVASFTYDGDGKRVKAVEGGETILFVGNHYEVKGSEITKYYLAGAARVAVRRYSVPSSSELTYLLGDHLGSASLATDETGALLVETRYKAWGEVRYTTEASTLPTRYTYTGQYSYVSDDATDLGSLGFGLMYYGARFYDPALGRFASADTIIPPGSQGYDRYAYTNNNPVRYVDPTGHFIETLFDIVSVGMDIADIAQNGLNWGNGISLAVDVASVLIPGIPAVGAAIRAVNAVDNVADAAKAVDKVADAANALDNIGDALKAADDLPNPPPGGNAQWINVGTNQSGATFWGPDRIVYTNNSDLLNAMNQHGPGIVLDGGHGTPTGQFIPQPDFFRQTSDFFNGTGTQVLDMNKLTPSDLMNLGEAGQNIYVNWCWGAYCTQILDAVAQ